MVSFKKKSFFPSITQTNPLMLYSLYATQHTDRETSIPQGIDATISALKVNNITPIQEVIFFSTNVNMHQSTNTSKYAT
jgi:hypothetical protein